MNSQEFKKVSLKIFVGFLALTAVVAIVSVLSGEFGSFQLKVLATTSAISAASICSMSCAAFIGRGRAQGLGFLGIFLSLSAAVFVIAGVWPEVESDEYWKFVVTLTVLAVAFAHAFLLLLPRLDVEHRWIQAASCVAIGVLSLQIIGAAWGEINDDVYYRILVVVAIIVALLTLVVPIMIKLRKGEGRKREKILLERVEGDLYRDGAGKEYRVTEITAPGSGPLPGPDRKEFNQ